MKLQFSVSDTDHTYERGQSLVELAVGVVVLFTMMAGIIDFGLAFINYVAMRDAAQEGAVYGSIHPASCAMIISHAQESSETLLAGSVISVKIDGVDCLASPALPPSSAHACAGKEIQVTVSQPHYPISMPFIGGLLPTPNEINLQATIKDTILSPKCPTPSP